MISDDAQSCDHRGGSVMSGGRRARVGDLVRPAHRQFGPQEPGYVIRVGTVVLIGATCQAVEIRRGDRTCADYVVTGPWSMELIRAAAGDPGVSEARPEAAAMSPHARDVVQAAARYWADHPDATPPTAMYTDAEEKPREQ